MDAGVGDVIWMIEEMSDELLLLLLLFEHPEKPGKANAASNRKKVFFIKCLFVLYRYAIYSKNLFKNAGHST